MALAGLAALGHRGAFAADGESSDGAGVLLPLERALLGLLAPGIEGRPGVISLFLPADPDASARARTFVKKALAAQGLRTIGQRDVPVDADALGSESRASLPGMLQVFVGSANGSLGNGGLDRHLLLARRRMEADALQAGITRLRGRVGVVADGRLQGPRLGLAPRRLLSGPARGCRDQPRGLPPALRDEHAPDLGARAAVPPPRPQRRGEHGPRRAGAAPGSSRPARRPARGRPRRLGPAHPSGRLGLALARRGARAVRRLGLAARCGAPARDRRGTRAAARPPAGARRLPRPHAGTPRAMGRASGTVLQRRPPRRRDPRPQRAAPARDHGIALRLGRRGVGGWLGADQRRGHARAPPPRSRRDVPRRHGPRDASSTTPRRSAQRSVRPAPAWSRPRRPRSRRSRRRR